MCRIHDNVTGVELMGMWQQCVGGSVQGVRSVQKGMRQNNIYWGKYWNVLIVGVPMELGIRNVPCEKGRLRFPGLE
jgi:hypothetical protein